ncbi:MAG: AAA family ATPase [Oscillospiraceae bacterium]|jgi:chromosome partitioning protein|nr:AAA family ATPase [Oscillospiraceae bacterium]
MGTILAIANQKSGVGKTTTAVSLGTALARKGRKVLIVDCDPQGNAGICFGVTGVSGGLSLASALNAIILREQAPKEIIMYQRDANVSLILSDISLAGVETTLVNVIADRKFMLSNYLEGVRDDFDYVILDCAPSLGMLTINALVAADEVLIPAQAQYLSAKGLEQLLLTVRHLKRRLNPGLEVLGILMTMVDARTNYAKDILENICQTYGGAFRVFGSVIPRSVRAEESTAAAQCIHSYDPKGKVALAYQALADEILGGGVPA